MKSPSNSSRSSRLRNLVIAISFGVNIALLIGVSFASISSRQKLASARVELRALLSIERKLAEIRQLLVSAESERRGSLLQNEGVPHQSGIGKEALGKAKDLSAGMTRFPELLSAWRQLEAEILLPVARPESNSSYETDGIDPKLRQRFRAVDEKISGLLEDTEERFVSRVNRLTWMLNLAAILAAATGIVGVVMLIGALREQERRRILEKEKRDAEDSDRQKSKFLASMNHEIRTPLNAMLGFSELLRKEVSSRKGERYLEAINESGESLSALINDILDLSKIESGILELEEEPTNIQDFARSIEMLFLAESESSGISLITEVKTGSVEVVSVDALRLRQVLVNLLGNAFKFTEEGSVTLRFLLSEAGRRNKETFVIEVEDTGRGIAPEKLELIFRPFRQAEMADEMEGGTGLGLSISRELAHLMDGSLTAESTEGEGSIFRLTLRNVKTGGEAVEESQDHSEEWDFSRLRPSTILAVDDNRYNRALIAGFFEDTPHRVLFGSHGKEGLEILEREEVDLVLMDIRMPVMGGEEARKRMRERPEWQAIPVVAITASSLLGEEKRLRKAFDGYLRKPFAGIQLYQILRKFLPPEDPTDLPDSTRPPIDETEPNESSLAPAEKKELMDRFAGERDGLLAGMVLSEIREWSHDLEAFSTECSSARLKQYAQELREKTDAFDQAALEEALSNFPELVESL